MSSVRVVEKPAGADSSDLRPIWFPTLDNLRNFLATLTVNLKMAFEFEGKIDRLEMLDSSRPLRA